MSTILVVLLGILSLGLFLLKLSAKQKTKVGAVVEDWHKLILKAFLPVVILFFVALTLELFVEVVDGQEVMVVVTPSGVSDQELHAGWNIVGPWNKTYRMDKTVWVYSFTTSKIEGAKPAADAIWCPTKDGIKMGFDFSISWRILPDEASWIYANVSEDDTHEKYLWIEENVIRPIVKSVMPLTVSEYTPIEIYSTKRQEIQDKVFKRIKAELRKSFRLDVVKVDIREVFYSNEFEKAIDSKKMAEQEALRLFEVTKQREELLKQEKINKDIAITKAQGESEALKIKGQSITNNPKIIELEWINKWDGMLPQYMMGGGSTNFLITPKINN